jgi:hypothetical protein
VAKLIKYQFCLSKAQSDWLDEEVEYREHRNTAVKRCTRSAVIREIIDQIKKREEEFRL